MSGFRLRRFFVEGVRFLRPLDLVVFLVAAGVIVAFSLFSVERGGAGAMVEIHTESGRYLYPLEEDVELSFEGPLGVSEVRIHDGEVRFTASPCRDKICITAGELTDVGQWAACLPNRIFVTVIGVQDEAGAVDATSF